MAWLNILLKGKKVAGAIKSVKPKLTKGDSAEVLAHKLKMTIKKGTDKVSEAVTTGKDKIIKSLDKMKDPKK